MTSGDRRWPLRIVQRTREGAVLEIGGESITVAGWPGDEPAPSGPVTVAGERVSAKVILVSSGGTARAPTPVAPTARASDPSEGGANAILPPMPGRVIEVRVSEGQRVDAGAVLLVLEAMKMRNEVTAPRAGTVRGLRVKAGDSVRAREAMLSVEP